MDEFLSSISSSLVLATDENTIFTYDTNPSNDTPAPISLLLKLHTVKPFNRLSLMKTLLGIWSSQCRFPVRVSKHVDVYGIPFMCKSHKLARFIASKIGDLIEVDRDTVREGTGPYLMLRILLDVNLPIRRGQPDPFVRGKGIASALGVKRPSFQSHQAVVGGFLRSTLMGARGGDREGGPSATTLEPKRRAIFQLSGGKAMGLDGLNAYFSKRTEILLVLKARYFPNSSLLEAILGHNPSYAWRSILWGRDLMAFGLIWKEGSLQIYTDAALDHHNKKHSYGIELDRVKAGVAKPCVGSNPAAIAEAKAIQHVIQWIQLLHLSVDVLKMDCKTIVDKVNSCNLNVSPLDDILISIKHLLSFSPNLKVVHNYRDSNQLSIRLPNQD
uniref:RNase H type-1 domain-containing protein n=1 Tax=Cannabis sativa TaxID=3483 RepID=A0A803PZX0_CANSA